MDDLDRLYRRLVHNIRANRPEYLQIPFTVRELYEQIIPYRHNRRELGIETNDDYEIAIARLLAGERGYLQGDPTMQEQLRRELASPTGDPGVFKDHGDATVSLTPAASDARTPVAGVGVAGTQTPVEAVPAMAASTPSAAPSPAAASAPAPAPAPASPNTPITGDAAPAVQSAPVQTADAQPSATSTAVAPEVHVPSLLSSLSHIEMPTGCRFCGGTLPEGRDANYCPHCGENLHTKRCPACGAEMDTSWAFCVTCGRKAG